MASGLARLIENVPDDNKLFLKHISKNDQVFELMKKKGQFPYEWFDDIEKLKLPIGELKREYFDNERTLSKLNDKEWEDILYIIEKLDIKTFLLSDSCRSVARSLSSNHSLRARSMYASTELGT